MIITVGPKLRIIADDGKNFIVERLARTASGARTWKLQGYYPSFSIALQTIVDKHLLFASDKTEDITEVLKRVTKLVKDIESLCQGAINATQAAQWSKTIDFDKVFEDE